MRRKEETFSSNRATTPLAAIMKSSISSVARFFSCFTTSTTCWLSTSRMHFAGVDVQRAMVVAQFLERLRNFVLQLELRLQFRRRGHFWRSRRRAFQPCSDRAVGELRLIANDGPIHVARTDRGAAIAIDDEFNHHGRPVHVLAAATTRPSKALPATSEKLMMPV